MASSLIRFPAEIENKLLLKWQEEIGKGLSSMRTIKLTAQPPYTVTNGTETKEVWSLLGLHLSKGDVLLDNRDTSDVGYYG